MNDNIAVVVSNDNQNVTALETIAAIKDAGFKNVFIQWYDKDFAVSQQEQVKYCQKLGLNIIFAHLGYQDINNIWLPDDKYESIVERYKKDIYDLHTLNVNTVLLHVSSKFSAPSTSIIGLQRLQRIVEYAQSINVIVLFENTKILTHIEYVFDNLKLDNYGLCFDVGHYHCNNKDNWDLTKFKDKILAVHLHDNDGSDDQHLLPFDGSNNWPKIVRILKESNYQGMITLEVIYRKEYTKMDIKDFYKLSYNRAKAIMLM